MKKSMEYETKYWRERRLLLLNNIDNDPNYLLKNINEVVERLNDSKIDVIKSYNTLALAYAGCASKFFLGLGDVERCKGYYNMAAKAFEMCYTLYHKGIQTLSSMSSKLERGDGVRYYTFLALLSDDKKLASEVAKKDLVLMRIIKEEFDDIDKFPEKTDDAFVTASLMNVVESNNNELKDNLENRIKFLRKQSKISITMIDEYGLGILKIAKMRGINCDINVAELPEKLLEDSTIEFDKWQLPIPERVKKILES